MLKKVSTMCLILLFVGSAFVMAQKPAPYSQLDPRPYDPKIDLDPDMFISSWKESMPRHEHGSLIVRDIFTQCKGDPLHPTTRGAVLTHLTGFSHGTLEAHTSTTPSTLRGEQKIFYIYSGKGTITAGGKTADLYKWIGVLIPANLEFTMKNTGNDPLNMYIFVEPVPEGFMPRKDMLVRDENVLPINSTTGHWVNITKRLFSTDDGLALILGMGSVWLDPMTMAQPHASVPVGVDVLWIALEGDINSLLGKKLRKMQSGSAYKNPGDGKFVHSNINVSDKPIKLFWTRTIAPE